MRRSDRTGPTGCSVALFTLVALMTHGVILDSIAARADQQGPKFIEVGMTANVTTSQALQMPILASQKPAAKSSGPIARLAHHPRQPNQDPSRRGCH